MNAIRFIVVPLAKREATRVHKKVVNGRERVRPRCVAFSGRSAQQAAQQQDRHQGQQQPEDQGPDRVGGCRVADGVEGFPVCIGNDDSAPDAQGGQQAGFIVAGAAGVERNGRAQVGFCVHPHLAAGGVIDQALGNVVKNGHYRLRAAFLPPLRPARFAAWLPFVNRPFLVLPFIASMPRQLFFPLVTPSRPGA